MASITTSSATKTKKIKLKKSTTQEPLEIDYVDVELFSENEVMKIGVGKFISDSAFHNG